MESSSESEQTGLSECAGLPNKIGLVVGDIRGLNTCGGVGKSSVSDPRLSLSSDLSPVLSSDLSSM